MLARSLTNGERQALTATSDQVFINCPFDADYWPVFDALVFTIYACGFRPRCALELDDGSEARIEKLYRIVGQCRYGIHDLSRTELDAESRLPRFNMPLELGIFLGAKRYGGAEQKLKRCLILDVERYRFQRFISDLAGMDIRDHGGDARRAVQCARDWIANVSRRKLPGHRLLLDRWDEFNRDLPEMKRLSGLAEERLPYADYEQLIVGWLTR